MQQIAQLKQLIADHEEELNTLSDGRLRLQAYFERFLDEMPLPAWIKAASEDGKFHTLTINKKYTEVYGITLEQYQIREDKDLWDRETADSFHKADSFVMENNSSKATVENFTLNGRRFNVLVWKWPINLDTRVVAVCGMVLPFGSVIDPLILDQDAQSEEQT